MQSDIERGTSAEKGAGVVETVLEVATKQEDVDSKEGVDFKDPVDFKDHVNAELVEREPKEEDQIKRKRKHLKKDHKDKKEAALEGGIPSARVVATFLLDLLNVLRTTSGEFQFNHKNHKMFFQS